jgi:alpha-L-arabinofuranosidase
MKNSQAAHTRSLRNIPFRVLAVALLVAPVVLAGQVGNSGDASGRASAPSSVFQTIPSQSVQLSATASSNQYATNIAIDGSTKVRGVQRFGINLGGQTFYDSGQILRNLVFRNPGFEGETFRTILHCAAATATSCTDTNIYAVWPANFVQGASFQFTYGKAIGETGTITSSTAASYSGKKGVTIFFKQMAHAPAVGDFVILEMSVPGNGQAGWWPSTSGGASVATESSDLSPATPGKQALRINASGAGQTAEVASYFDSYNGRSFVQLHGTYQLSFRAKGLGAGSEVSVSLVRAGASSNTVFFSQTVLLPNQWENYTFNISTSETGTSVGTVSLKFDVAKTSMLLDDVALTAPASSGNTTAFRDEVVSTLKALRPGVIRYEDSNGAGLGNSIDNAIAPPFARIRTGYSEQETERDDITIGLHEVLQLCQQVGANPWYNVPLGVSPTEMQNLIEYLGGDASTPYGAKRAARGQVEPWTSVFPKIYLELGNEAWNDGSFHGASMPDPVAYGNRASTIFAAARKSPYYQSEIFNLVLGSWAAVPYWTSTEMANSGSYDTVDAAPYLFNSLNDTSSTEAIFGPMFAQPESVDSVSTGSMYQQAAAAAGTSGVTPAALAVYEVNLSTLAGTASQANVNAVVPSEGAGIALLDHMLLMTRDLGITVQNMFALPEYNNSFTNPGSSAPETSPLFGAVVDMGGETNLRRPIFLAEQLANTAILPDLLTTTLSGANPTWNQPHSTNDNIQLSAAHELQTFAFSDGGSGRSLILFNLSRTSSLPITLSGADGPTGALGVSVLASTNLTDTNEATSKVRIVDYTVQNYSPGTLAYIPPHSMIVVKWTAR